ncbi:riboflavin kinase/FMN adenylyltransferase [Clostridium pascui]|uniref:bifunctional riboflavin kinase/FAD synthetase n=1 Tax=Clostridium pascui TaxID=46609 RepID=UPI00195C2A05|nr:bifunctional riboflavin kinase/FAD synthetase [Clostridium pascui]MBM7868989.1 riboflavin kinase/FMN adenylyltransferase [Clostridium pascui]
MDLLGEEINKKIPYDTYIALGSFDGLHLGHRALVQKAIEVANKNKGKSMIYTFKNHPLSIINKEIMPKLLMDNDMKIRVLDHIGVDYLSLINFSREFMEISPEDFISNIVENYNAKGIIVGFNYRFGYKNLGDITLLKKLSVKYNFKLYVINPIKQNNELISSSRIRNIISEQGDIKKANSMLYVPFSIEGKVVRGRQIGREIGFPTINLDYNKDYVIPKGGVYSTIVKYKDKFYKGVTNIGYNPTVENHKLSIETHILGFNNNIYDETIRVYFTGRIRDEKKFDSLEELACRIEKDKGYVEKQNLQLISKNNLLL